MSLNAKNRSEKGFKMHKSLQIWGWFLPKKIDLPTQGRSGNFRGSKNQKSGKCHELSRKSITFVFTHPTRGGGVPRGGGQNVKSPVNFMNCRENREKKLPPPPPKGVAVGILGSQQIKSPGNVMNCREK